MKLILDKVEQRTTGDVRRFIVQVLVGVMLLSFFSVNSQAQHKRQFETTVGNFGQIDAKYYRGEQPKDEEFHQLKQMGIKTIIDLRDNYHPKAAAWAREAGLQYINIPLSDRRPATDEQTAYFLKIVNDPRHGPVFVHCKGGRHRTGEMTAIYRITNYGWSADQAYREMKQYDWYSRWGHGPLKGYVYDYYNRKVVANASTPAVTAAAQAAAR